jgi:predicted DNA-binding transcriptional regulator AlpA
MRFKPRLVRALASLELSAEELAGLAEIAAMFGVTKATAQKYAKRADFPEPLGEIAAAGRVWRRDEVQAWGTATLPLRPGRPRKGNS